MRERDDRRVLGVDERGPRRAATRAALRPESLDIQRSL
jgi:hypothetical protein